MIPWYATFAEAHGKKIRKKRPWNLPIVACALLLLDLLAHDPKNNQTQILLMAEMLHHLIGSLSMLIPLFAGFRTCQVVQDFFQHEGWSVGKSGMIVISISYFQLFGADWNHENLSDSVVDFVKGEITKEFSLIFRDEIPWFKFPTFSGLNEEAVPLPAHWLAWLSVAGMGLRLSVPFFWPISFVWTPPWQPSTLGYWGAGICTRDQEISPDFDRNLLWKRGWF